MTKFHVDDFAGMLLITQPDQSFLGHEASEMFQSAIACGWLLDGVYYEPTKLYVVLVRPIDEMPDLLNEEMYKLYKTGLEYLDESLKRVYA